MKPLIPRTTTSFLLPLLLLFSLFLLVRGHNAPGGGFTGGLVAAAAFTLYALAFGVREASRVLPVPPRLLIGGGLLVALFSGVAGLLGGHPLLTGLWIHLYFPGGGALDLGTPLLFDVGVYLVVMGVSLTIFMTLADE